ncbi:MAG: hypothetical protein ACLUJG_01460 [Lawsonibacter sp.]
MLLLLRSPGAVLHHYIRALNEAGLPWSADGGQDFLPIHRGQRGPVPSPDRGQPPPGCGCRIAALRSPVYGFSRRPAGSARGPEAEGDFYSAVVPRRAGRGDQDVPGIS